MDLEAFRESLRFEQPPAGLSLALQALWWDAHSDWIKAHEHAQRDEGPEGAWVHAYLHRKEGDLGNAGYWYRRAQRRTAIGPLEQEWQEIVEALLQRANL